MVQAGKGSTLTFSSNNRKELVLSLPDVEGIILMLFLFIIWVSINYVFVERDEWITAIKNAQLFIQQEHQRHITLSDKYFNEFMEVMNNQ